MTLVEVVVVIFVIGVVVLMLLPVLASPHRHMPRITCVNNLKETYLGIKIWEGDHGNKFPMNVSTNLGGALEYFDNDELGRGFMVASNQLATPIILVCQTDVRHRATNFDSMRNSNISYFADVDATESDPNSVIFGDRNILGGIPLPHGLTAFNSANPVHWDSNMHHNQGNVALADGSASQLTSLGLYTAFDQSTNMLGQATNHYAFP